MDSKDFAGLPDQLNDQCADAGSHPALAPRHAVGDLVIYCVDSEEGPLGEVVVVEPTGYRVIWGDDEDSRAGGILLYSDDELRAAYVATPSDTHEVG